MMSAGKTSPSQGDAHRPAAEMAEVGIQATPFPCATSATRRARRGDARVVHEDHDAVIRVHGREDAGIVGDVQQAGADQDQETRPP
jgi:hypothetical protein